MASQTNHRGISWYFFLLEIFSVVFLPWYIPRYQFAISENINTIYHGIYISNGKDMEWFRNKRELLEYLGKNPEDRKLVDRMIKRGDVVFDGGMYGVEVEKHPVAAVPEDERRQYLEMIKDLEKENGKLNRDISNLEQEKGVLESKLEQIEENRGNNLVKKSDDDLMDHLEFLYNRNKMKDEVIQKLVNQFYEKNRQSYSYEGAKEEVYKRFGYVENTEEEGEMEYVKGLIKINEL